MAVSFLDRYASRRAQLSGEGAVRDQAAAFFRTAGLPTRKVEAWKYTDLRPIALGQFQAESAQRAEAPDLSPVAAADGGRLVFVGGRFRDDLSVRPGKATFHSFAERPAFGDQARPDQEPIVALNTMFAEDGASIDVAPDTDAGMIHLASLGPDAAREASDFYPRHRIRLGRGARLVLLETATGSGPYLHAPVTEIDVAAGATLIHIRQQEEGAAAFHLATAYATVAEGGSYDGFTLNLGSRLCRAEFHADMRGPNARVQLNCIQLLSDGQHADLTSVVCHEAPHGVSRQTVKNVLTGRSRAVFQGRIGVARAAQKTDGYQMSESLLLSPDAEVDTKPELEIFADDVKCSHGATVGQLEAEELFYLRSRGIPEAEARSVLVRAFLAEAIEAIPQEGARASIELAVDRWWQRQAL